MRQLALILILLISLFCSCERRQAGKGNTMKIRNSDLISDPVVQDSLFKRLKRLTKDAIPACELQDSLAFLILPMEASCPACRRKAIDSIVKYKDRLDEKHYVVIIGNGSRSIQGYFSQQNKSMPLARGILYDTLELSAEMAISSTNPNIYYSHGQKVYLKVSCLPATIKEDLKVFYANQ